MELTEQLLKTRTLKHIKHVNDGVITFSTKASESIDMEVTLDMRTSPCLISMKAIVTDPYLEENIQHNIDLYKKGELSSGRFSSPKQNYTFSVRRNMQTYPCRFAVKEEPCKTISCQITDGFIEMEIRPKTITIEQVTLGIKFFNLLYVSILLNNGTQYSTLPKQGAAFILPAYSHRTLNFTALYLKIHFHTEAEFFVYDEPYDEYPENILNRINNNCFPMKIVFYPEDEDMNDYWVAANIKKEKGRIEEVINYLKTNNYTCYPLNLSLDGIDYDHECAIYGDEHEIACYLFSLIPL